MKNIQKTGWYLLAGILALVTAFPLLWMVFSSFKPESELFTNTLTFFPKTWTFDNYVVAWNSAPWRQFFFNTFFVALAVVICQLITCTLAGYALSVLSFRGQTALFLCVLGANMIPFEATLIPSYLLIVKLGWLNTYQSLILPTATGVLGIFIMRQNFMSIPKELFEAAEMDHAGTFRTFRKVALPLSKTSMATVALFAFLNSWNSYIWPLTVTTKTDMRTIQVGLSYMIDADLGIQWGALMAAAAFIIIPVLILFFMLQKYFVKGLMRTGIK